jgi:hypothetical protein
MKKILSSMIVSSLLCLSATPAKADAPSHQICGKLYSIGANAKGVGLVLKGEGNQLLAAEGDGSFPVNMSLVLNTAIGQDLTICVDYTGPESSHVNMARITYVGIQRGPLL